MITFFFFFYFPSIHFLLEYLIVVHGPSPLPFLFKPFFNTFLEIFRNSIPSKQNVPSDLDFATSQSHSNERKEFQVMSWKDPN